MGTKEPSSPASPPVLGFGPAAAAGAAKTPADCHRGQGEVLAPACLSHLAEHHPAISASEPHAVATPKPPESLQPLGPKRCPIHEMPFICKLQTVSHISKRFPVFLSCHPHRHILLPPAFTELFGTALDWSRLQSVQLATEKSTERGKGAHTSLQKCLSLHFCLIRNGLTSCMVDELYIDDSILLAV